MTFENANVLISGGLGFIGSTLAIRIRELGAKVSLIDTLYPHYGGNLFNVESLKDRVAIHRVDLRDGAQVRELVRGQDFVFNLAGQTSHLDSMTDPQADLAANCSAQLNLLEACRTGNPTAKIVHASTRQIYGRPSYLPVDEGHPLRPVDINGIHKLAGEQYFSLYHRVYGMRTTVLRLTNTIGPRMRVKDARQTFLGIWVSKLLRGEAIEVWGGEQLRDFTDVDDAVDAFLLAALKTAAEGQIYNLGGNEVLNLRQLAQMMVELTGGKFVVREYPSERSPIDIGDYYADYSKITAALGWTPRIPLRATLIRTLDYYRDALPHYL
ncbi:MAG: NAD-dependent epimerase/dehydratase family protein [Verrucomicrobiota bacterium]|nr:NAD-dependent epimerase/dehydratase family protein [Verrucomicrobiota bacterium]